MNTLKKISGIMKKIFGWGILLSLAVGCLMFLGYVAALIIGGEVAAAICHFLYKQLTPVLIYITSALVLFGLVAMYLGGEVALSNKKTPKAKPEDKSEKTAEAAADGKADTTK